MPDKEILGERASLCVAAVWAWKLIFVSHRDTVLTPTGLSSTGMGYL